MSGVLAIVETRQGCLREVSFEVVEAALTLSRAGAGPVTAVVIDRAAMDIAQRLTETGVDEVLAVTTPVEHFEAHVWATEIERLVIDRSPLVVVGAHTVDGMAWAPAVAYRAGAGFAADVVALDWADGALQAHRLIQGERLQQELTFDQSIAVVTVRAGAFAFDLTNDCAEVVVTECAPASVDAPRAEHLCFVEPDSDDAGLANADFVMAVGRGVGDEDGLAHFERLSEQIGATLAVSRPLVDAGWAASSRQVGQSGQTIAPRIYLALGISGAVQHLAGIRGAGTVIAVNIDPAAPIFEVADVAVVADIFEFADALAERLA